MDNAARSIGVLLKLASAFNAMRTDNLFKEVLSLSDNVGGLDLRTRFNYLLLMFSTGKVG